MSTINNTTDYTADPIDQFNKATENADVLVPNFYLREDIGECKDWSDEKWDAFKDYVNKIVCVTDWVHDGVSECIGSFKDEHDEPEEAEEPAESKTEEEAKTAEAEPAEAKTEEPAAEAKTEEPAAEDTDLEENTDDSEEEEELAGDLCAGASDPALVIIYTMAGGGAHWWNYEVHYDDDGQQAEVYINNINGCRFQRGQVLFYYEDQPDQLRLEDRDFDEDKWVLLEHYA